MKNKKYIRLARNEEKVLLSDVLPYEVPVIFSNREFYSFLIRNKFKLISNRIPLNNAGVVEQTILKLLTGTFTMPINSNEIKFSPKLHKSIPFTFKISHKENDFRQLTIIHPKNQLAIIEFYDRYKALILYYCSLSSYSIRKPHREANYKYFKDKTHSAMLSNTHDADYAEQYNKEYESLKTFFVYKKFSNIHKFYESYNYQRCERKFAALFKFDIMKCFDSIYTHSIFWAIYNKTVVKNSLERTRDAFPDNFDSIMQNLNHGETNGIVIGPEFSRIFAEMILQRIDRNVETYLQDKEKLKHKKDYEIFRYVDDYFIFYNDEISKQKILDAFRIHLREYKLFINDSKSIVLNKPIITNITVAKQKIGVYFDDLFGDHTVFLTNIDRTNSDRKIDNKPNGFNWSANSAITNFKIIIHETNISYHEIMSFTLSVIDKKLGDLSKSIRNDLALGLKHERLSRFFLKILDLSFFLYEAEPKVSYTIKLCSIINRVMTFLKTKKILNADLRHLIFKLIFDRIADILKRNRAKEYTQLESMYLLITLSEFGKGYYIPQEVLIDYLNIEKDSKNQFYTKANFNYFSLMVVLFYIKSKSRYSELRQFLEQQILTKFNEIDPDKLGQHAELTFLLFDSLTCPYLGFHFKQKLLSLVAITNPQLQASVINYSQTWFIKWKNFNLGRELLNKTGIEVY